MDIANKIKSDCEIEELEEECEHRLFSPFVWFPRLSLLRKWVEILRYPPTANANSNVPKVIFVLELIVHEMRPIADDKCFDLPKEDSVLTKKQKTKETEKKFVRWTDHGDGSEMSSLESLDDLRQKYGVVSQKQKIKTLEHWLRKNKDSDYWSLIEIAENFTGKGIDQDVVGHPDNRKILEAVVRMIPKQKWMRFVRLELGLNREEIKGLHRQFATFSKEQKFEILEHWFTHGRLHEELPACTKDESSKELEN